MRERVISPLSHARSLRSCFVDHHHHGLCCRYPERALRSGPEAITATSEKTDGDEQETTRDLERALRIDRGLSAFGRSPTVESASQAEAQPR